MKVLIVYAHPNPKSFNHAVLENFARGLKDGGNTYEVVDLYAKKFDPVYNLRDFTFWNAHDVPMKELERRKLKEQMINSAGGYLKQLMAKMFLRNKSIPELVDIMIKMRPKDVLAQQEKIVGADGLVFIAPIIWMHFPAILKGWVERVFTYGFAWGLTPEAYKGNLNGRVPLLKIEKALSITTTGWKEEDYIAGGYDELIRNLIDVYGLKYPGIPDVEHLFLYAVPSVDDKTRKGYLDKVYQTGMAF